MQSIVVIAPENTSFEIVQRIAGELGMQDKIRLHLTGLSRSLDFAHQAEADGAHVIVARGWSANQIVESGIRTPVVFLPVSMQDLTHVVEQALLKASSATPRLGFVTYPQLENEIKAIARLLQIDLRVYPSKSTFVGLREAVHKAKADGMEIIIGGETTAALAERLELPCQILTCGEASIRQALQDADRVVYARELEQAQTLKFKTVLEHSNDGVVSLDAHGRVLLVNPVAQRMLRLKNDITNHHIKEIATLPKLDRCLLLGKRVMDEMAEVEGRRLLFSAIPIHVGEAVRGAVISFQEPQAIAVRESKIRRDTSDSGMRAQYSFDDIHGCSAPLTAAVVRAKKFAQSQHSVLIYGETGTGKELFAQSIHNASPLRNGPFVAVNCGALPRSLLESELFGYEEGAFTGASRKGKPGLFELADQGTIFLDEVAELDHHAQQRLLRVLEAQSVMRIGGTRHIPVDVRIVAATNANLWERVQNNQFRADLFYRLSVLLLQLPALRDRDEDMVQLARHFLKQAAEGQTRDLDFTPGALDVLRRHPWPGNVRELRYFIQRVCAIMPDTLDESTLQAELLAAPSSMDAGAKAASSPLGALASQSADFERESILRALLACDGHQGRTAQLLQVDRSTLFRKMQRLGIR